MSLQDHLSTDEPVPFAQPSWLEWLRLKALINFIGIAAPLNLAVIRYRYGSAEPDKIISYSSQPSLKHRVFFPPGYESGQDYPPLFLDIHGGGFFLFDPSCDDNANAMIAKDAGCLVISLDYSKSPTHKFPVAMDDLVDAVLQILDDDSISFDKSKVVIGGYSAGGNLCLSVSQSPKLQGKLQGVVSFYPITDWLTSTPEKLSKRAYERPGDVDMLAGNMEATRFGYVPVGQDLKDPLLSVYFADRSKLPKWVLFVGAEYDLLCHEAWLAARKYAGLEKSDIWEEDKAEKYGFEECTVKWMMVRGAIHGYTHHFGETGEKEVKRRRQVKECYTEIYEWLKAGPFASQG